MNSLIQNVSNIDYLINRNKTNSIILNYDDKSNEFFIGTSNWLQKV